MHVSFGFGLIQKNFHNMSSKEYSGLNKLAFDFASNLLNLNGRRGGKSINPLTAFQTIKKANDETIKSIMEELVRYPNTSTGDRNGSDFRHLKSLNCSENQTTLIAGILVHNHVSMKNVIALIRSLYILILLRNPETNSVLLIKYIFTTVRPTPND